MVKKIENVYQVVFVMEDGAELSWKLFRKLEHYKAFVESVSQADLNKLGIAAIRYRTRFIE